MSIGRYALAGVIASTFATTACTAASGADQVTLQLAAPMAAGQAAPVASLLPRIDASSSSLTVVVERAIEATRREQRDRAAAVAKRAVEEKANDAATHSQASQPAGKPQATKKSGGDCARRAMAAGQFDPSCSVYQGYLDPGTSAGRAPTSGEIQMQFVCQQGLVPESDC